MSMATLKAQHKAFVQSMYDQGMLDHQFAQLQALQDAENPEFVVEVVTLFCNDAERILTELNNYLGQSVVDYYNVRAYVHQLQGSSSSIGAQKIKLSCVDLRLASDNHNREGCLRAFNRIQQDYFHLRSKFETLVQVTGLAHCKNTCNIRSESGK